MARQVCDREHLQDWFDGRLSGTEIADVLAHVRECSSCGAAVEDWRELRESLRTAFPMPALPQALPAFRLPPRRTFAEVLLDSTWWLAGSAAAAAALVVVLLQLVQSPVGNASPTMQVLNLGSPDARKEWVEQVLPLPSTYLVDSTSTPEGA